MISRWYLKITLITGVLGMLFVAFKQEWIVIRYPGYTTSLEQPASSSALKKSVRLVSWHDKNWHSSSEELLVPIELTDALSFIITTWLAHSAETSKNSTHVTVQTTLMAHNGHDLYISFDKNPLPGQQSVFEQWMFVEGLLRTIQAYAPTIQRVHFLVNHQPMVDEQLDFSQPWPITGFSS